MTKILSFLQLKKIWILTEFRRRSLQICPFKFLDVFAKKSITFIYDFWNLAVFGRPLILFLLFSCLSFSFFLLRFGHFLIFSRVIFFGITIFLFPETTKTWNRFVIRIIEGFVITIANYKWFYNKIKALKLRYYNILGPLLNCCLKSFISANA